MTPDFSRFWYEVSVACLWEIHHRIALVAMSERFSRQHFNAYSATARLRVVAALAEFPERLAGER